MVYYSGILGKIGLLHFDETFFNIKILIADYYKRKLWISNDGKGLASAGTVPPQDHWINYTNRFISGRDFINYIKFRINALPSCACV